jgi:hypothetical protein
MTTKKLHIVSWDIPFPADYGGVIDVFYTIKNLQQAGVKIILHCFQYGQRNQQEDLLQFCEVVYYYPRLKGMLGLHFTHPYIVSSRKCQLLLERLSADEYPILFEGIHTTYYANHNKILHKRKFFRAQNVEQDYYQQLALNSTSLFKKIYFYWEAVRLKTYETQLLNLQGIITVAQHDSLFFNRNYPTVKSLYLPSFQEHNEVKSIFGKGTYCLYHGNLSVSENEKSALFLIEKIFYKLQIKLIVAGKNPSQYLLSKGDEYIEIIPNPDELQLAQLIINAHIHVLPSFQSTGLKLKLLHALFCGRFCLVNDEMIVGTGFGNTIEVANDEKMFIKQIKKLMDKDFLLEDFTIRKNELLQYFPQLNAMKLIEFIFD